MVTALAPKTLPNTHCADRADFLRTDWQVSKDEKPRPLGRDKSARPVPPAGGKRPVGEVLRRTLSGASVS